MVDSRGVTDDALNVTVFVSESPTHTSNLPSAALRVSLQLAGPVILVGAPEMTMGDHRLICVFP
jgi:hypothetical protein